MKGEVELVLRELRDRGMGKIKEKSVRVGVLSEYVQ